MSPNPVSPNPVSLNPVSLNPAQQEIADRLRGDRQDRPSYDAELRHHLRARLEHGMATSLAQLPTSKSLVVSKNRLTNIHGCEARYLADEFVWTVAAARGRVAHKAIELSVNWRRELIPLVLVDEALARLEEGEDDFARWLQGLGEAERAELRSEANDRVAKFLECWPPLPRSWRPVTESSVRQDVCAERIVLRGKVDLTLGVPDGLVAGKVLVDLKTGATKAAHLDDLRFYALVETLRLGTPPLRLGTYYLDQGRLLPEDVTEALLETTVQRVVDGVERMIELETKARPPVRRPGPACRWCPLQEDCDDGQTWIRTADDDLDLG
jgi:CRISPR/Cas system-associated exonuclease Cas4 (RecB family)